MNRKGFTLIELIVTIMLLAIIVLIALPSINGILDKNNKNNCESLKRSITEAVKLYASDNRYNLKWKTTTKKICEISDVTDSTSEFFNYYITTVVEENDDGVEQTVNKCYLYESYISLPNNRTRGITVDDIKDYLKKDITNPCDSNQEVSTNNTEDIEIKIYRYKDLSLSYKVNFSEKFGCCTSE